jgi:hypothetical protein
MAMSSDDQKALLKKVYSKNRDRLEPIAPPLFMSPKPGEPYKKFTARKKQALKDQAERIKRMGKSKFNKELSEGSDKKLKNRKKG